MRRDSLHYFLFILLNHNQFGQILYALRNIMGFPKQEKKKFFVLYIHGQLFIYTPRETGGLQLMAVINIQA